jgi:mono/diheme cytochrome c family protein
MKFKIILFLGLVMLAIISACQSESQLEFARYYSAGSLVYQTKCQNCHGKNGEGLLSMIPPLTDTAYLKNNRKMLACLVLNGLRGKYVLVGKPFEGNMPPSGLNQVDIANVLTYVGNSFGNKMGTISIEEVGNNLSNCK